MISEQSNGQEESDHMARKPAKPTMKKIPKRVSTRPTTRMETFANPNHGRDYEIEMTCPEFTCLCPMT